MRYVSDLDYNLQGKPTVEWEWEEGGRLWEVFESEEARKLALSQNNERNRQEQEEIRAKKARAKEARRVKSMDNLLMRTRLIQAGFQPRV